jgi:hypothetical protein
MPTRNVFHWIDGRGWLVLSGGPDRPGELRALALERAAADGGLAAISINGLDAGEKLLDDLSDLGAPSGYLVDLASEDDETIQSKLAEAGMVVIEGGATASEVRSSLYGAAIAGIQKAYENGAVILVEGTSAMVFGEWVRQASGELTAGLEWLKSALILLGADVAEPAKKALISQPEAIAVGIGVGSALALGPDGEIETWGKKEITVLLGSKYIA